MRSAYTRGAVVSRLVDWNDLLEQPRPPLPPDAIWLISRDESTPNYTVLYYDARSVSRVYKMSFSDGVWKMWRESPGFWQRYEGKLSKDSNTITAHWEKSPDGTKWEHDFDLTYTKVS